jgi:alkylated DNA repair dioxygenase AlkB
MLLVENEIKDEPQVIQEGILCITPSEETALSTVYLSESKTSWITIEWISEELRNYSTVNYQELFDLHPLQRGKIVSYHDAEIDSPRWHRSYLYQPERELHAKATYMYSGIDRFDDLALPLPFQKYLDFLNEKETTGKYNQVIANWYTDGEDFIAPHSDCQKGMLPDADIAILTLCEDEKMPRELKITAKNLKNEKNDNLYDHVKIKLKHGSIITMYGETQNKFRHGVPKALNNYTSRISLTFRKFL